MSRPCASLGVVPDDLYIRLEPWPHIGRPSKHNLETWTVTDDWPEHVPIPDAELDVFEAWFGNLFDELFGPCLLVARRPDQRHPVKAKPLRGGACRASLDRLSLAQRGLSKQVRLIGSVDAPMPTQRAGVGSDPKEELAK